RKAAQERFAPDTQPLGPDVLCVVNHGQGAQKPIGRTERHRADVNVLIAELLEGLDFAPFMQALLHDGWSTLQPRPQIIRYCHDISLWVVDRQTDEVLPIGEA